MIRASVETDILISISKLNTTKDTLVELKKKYYTLDTEGRIEKMIRLFKSQLNNEDITKYISDKQNLFNEINSIKAEEGNELLPEVLLMIAVIVGLPKRYEEYIENSNKKS